MSSQASRPRRVGKTSSGMGQRQGVVHGDDQPRHVPDRKEGVGRREVHEVEPGPGHRTSHRQHVAEPAPALGRGRRAGRLADLDDDPLEPRRESSTASADGRSMITTSWCVVPRRRARASSKSRENRPKPRRLDRQLPSKPMRIGLRSSGRPGATSVRRRAEPVSRSAGRGASGVPASRPCRRPAASSAIARMPAEASAGPERWGRRRSVIAPRSAVPSPMAWACRR